MPDDAPWRGRRLHFIGIGGAGMSGLALVAQALGAEVTGSDRAESSYLTRLRDAGISPAIGHAAEHVPDGAEVIYSTAVAPDNPERAAARERGLTERHRGELLGEISALKRCIAVSGTHGKTTTAAMIAHVLRACGLDPAYLVGGELRDTGSNAGWGGGEWIVVEADESDRSLLELRPEVAVLTNVELDHHATYGSRLDLEATLRAFLALAPRAVVWDRPELLALRDGPVVAFDVPDAQLDAGGARFEWRGLEVRLGVPGHHNALNAAAALTASELAGADPKAAAAALAGFHGASRRFQRLGCTASGAEVYDDYAHHPTEVRATLQAARTLEPRRLVAVFQPHLYSRTAALWRDFGDALALADLAVVLEIYEARERAADFPGVSGRLVAQAAADAGGGRRVAWLPAFDDAERFLRRELRAGDVCLMLGAGDIDALGRRLVEGAPPVATRGGQA
ncbi:MAG: UDP-N-acetylmuramate--alanine ligase [Solirubrobacteraceae bacterium]|nr:UDP-N-acetylmuramate--alanine ligase [Solirubrobacteraceae bacterium]